jgi:sulfite reductase beta subunit-like hemoprotein
VYAGVSPDEAFDVQPFAEALTRYLLRHPLSSSLPRKFKIAFEGCVDDHIFTSINDLGLRAKVREVNGKKERGFRVTVAGGTAILCTNAHLLHEFIPVSELFNVAEAVVRVFHRLGDRKHRQRNRLKFLVRDLGWDSFLAEYQKELSGFHAEGGASLGFDPENAPVEQAPTWQRTKPPTVEDATARTLLAQMRGPGIIPTPQPTKPAMNGDLTHFIRTNVRAQKQPGYSVVMAHLMLGDFSGAQMRLLAEISLSFGDGQVRVTPEQDFVFRWVRDEDVPKVYELLCAIGLGRPDAGTIADITSCPGAESCKLAVTQSRGLGKLLAEFLAGRPDLVSLAPDVKIKMSGCPNGCGQHHIAGLGFQGSIRKVGDKVAPQYFVMVGGVVDDKGARFGRIAAKVPARRIPEVVERLLGLYRDQRQPSETATAFFARIDVPTVKAKLSDLEQLTPETAKPDDFVDLGESAQYKPETSEGECAA